MTDEEKKAIKELTEIKELFEEDLKENYEVTATLDQIDLESLVIVLNLIEKQSKEIEELKNEVMEKELIIDEMVIWIDDHEDPFDDCHENSISCADIDCCKDCIKKYFEERCK